MSRRFRMNHTARLSGAVLVIVTGLTLSASELDAQARGSGATEPNLKVAFIADQGNGRDAEAVLRLIRSEGADMVVHAGDFDYEDDPGLWESQVNDVLGADFPYFGAIGNHDDEGWGGGSGYQARLERRAGRISGAECSGDMGVKSSCRYRGLFMILSGVGTMGSGHDSYIRQQLAADNSIWRVCVWHKNQTEMQVGGKDSDVGWGAYEACREGGAIIATGHEHSYSRTKTLVDVRSRRVDPEWSDPGQLRVAPGATFAFVSGLGGRSIREQQRCQPARPPYGCNGEWASIYTSDQGAEYGALFIEFHVNGDPRAARGYFKNIDGRVIDEFTITAGDRPVVATNRPRTQERPAQAEQTRPEPPPSPPARRTEPERRTPPAARPAPRPEISSAACVVSRERWEGTTFGTQNGTFSVEFDIVPERARINAITGLSLGRPTEYDDLAVSVRFSPDGVIDSRDGGDFEARTHIRYEPGVRYHVRLVVRVHEREYDVYITPPGGSEQTLALNHDFRDDRDDVDGLDHWALYAKRDGSHQVCGFSGPYGGVLNSSNDSDDRR